MTPNPLPEPPPAALAAFLRGCERRGAVFAALQCGDAERGDVALAAALRAFRAHAAELPMAAWPARFWSLLVAAPPLRSESPVAQRAPSMRALADIAAPDRAALLLRLAGGLQEEEAAGVLGQSADDYRAALARACPRDAAGRPDADAWRQLAEAVQTHLRDLPPERLARLARLREEALAGTRIPPAGVSTAPALTASPARTPRRWPWVVLVLALMAAALGATWWPGAPWAALLQPAPKPASDAVTLTDPDIRQEALPPAEPPAARFDAEEAARTDRDAPMRADPEVATLVPDADFLAWYVVQRAATAAAAVAPEPASPRAPPDEGAEAAPAPTVVAPEPLHPRDALTRQRADYAAWQALGEVDRARLRAAARDLAAQPVETQQALRTRFAALDAMEHRGWRLGPALGAVWPRLQPMFAYVPAREREPLLALLRQLDAAALDDLAALSQRVPPPERDRFRHELIRVPAGERAAWLHARRER
ncbi:hypothetical protein [Pseudoxanthomonas sp. Root630]|uniref:hypothetical protein n=1 Tax=Pseudoxanthomonas sp. Root630 TaxID=1736574 RepID=UPI000703B615|nr:hypothetical protein [Pseudoxanthomonas sp. Root630]KRA46254.1 hypothetical protein ASD72_03290 [Pseudoxanthomonas sp. Root630]